jgi:hypothetical protein
LRLFDPSTFETLENRLDNKANLLLKRNECASNRNRKRHEATSCYLPPADGEVVTAALAFGKWAVPMARNHHAHLLFWYRHAA